LGFADYGKPTWQMNLWCNHPLQKPGSAFQAATSRRSTVRKTRL